MYANVRVRVLTGAMKNAGTNANVYISFRNKVNQEWTTEFELDTPRDDFEAGHMDVFKLEIGVRVRDVDKIRIRHDNTGKKPGWFLSMVVLEDINTREYVYFPFNRWLAVDEEDGLSAEIDGNSRP